MTERMLDLLSARLIEVPGVRAVMLGGSRARGSHAPDSDFDIGLYYESSLDTGALQELAVELSGPGATVTSPGAWGPWVDGGGWLRVSGADVDWIYRDLDRVRQSWAAACSGQVAFHAQAGHPLGVPDFAYAGEVALGVVLSDPYGQLAELQRATRTYPAALADALVEALWEADFLVANARKAVGRADAAFVAGCLFRVVALCAHALHGRAGRWLIHEKGAVSSAAGLPVAPPDFEARVASVVGRVGSTTPEVEAAVDAAHELVTVTRESCHA